MSTPKFTPGPWAVFDTHPERACFYIDRADQQQTPIGDVAVIYTTTNETNRANAHLISAAPDLLAALKAYQSANRIHNDAESDLYDAGRAAIAKAAGR